MSVGITQGIGNENDGRIVDANTRIVADRALSCVAGPLPASKKTIVA